MKILLIVWICFVGTTNMFAQGSSQTNEPSDLRETKKAAFEALVTLQELGRRTTFKEMGFQSVQEMADAKLGEPLAVFMVELNDLRSYQPGSDANKMLKPIDKVIYPVNANNQVRTSIVLQKGKDGWKTSDFGGANFARLATRARDESARTNNLPPAAFFVVQAPALNAYFLGYRQAGKLMLTSLIDDPDMNLKAGAALPAEQVFDQLHPLAEKYNGLPM